MKRNFQTETGRTEQRSHHRGNNFTNSDTFSIEDEISLNDLTARSLAIDDEGSQVRSHSSWSGSDAF